MKNNTPKLSIVTVNLNNKLGLTTTAESIVAQTWTDYEWIIIDGGSTDGSVEVIKEYADKTTNLVYWCSEPDGGIYQGMNKGIEKASGEYCWFLNSGDYAYENTSLAKIFANEFNEDIVYGNIKMIYPPESEKKRKNYTINTKKNNPYDPIDWVNNTAIRHQASFIRRDLFIRTNFYKANDYIISADTEFFVRAIFKHSAKVKHINIIFAMYICDGMSCKSEMRDKMRIEYGKIILENFPKAYEKIIAKSYIRKKIKALFGF